VKAAGRKGIIFAAFIDDAKVPMGGRLIIWNHPVQFPHLKRSWVAFIIQADSKLEGLVVSCFHDQSRNGSFSFNSLLPMPCASFQ
jgi:hypothetical protein